MIGKYKRLFLIIFAIIFCTGIVYFSQRSNIIKTEEPINEYSEIITELENRYGQDRNFKVIKIIGETIDQRGYRPSNCNDGYTTSDWQGKYYKDAILRIAIDYDKTKNLQTYFDITNNICTIRSGYADRFVLGLDSEHQFIGTIVNVYRNGAGLVVEPNENEIIRNNADQIYVPSRVNVNYEVGMKVIVYYNGEANNGVWPASIDTVDVLVGSNVTSSDIIDIAYNHIPSTTRKIIIDKYDARVSHIESFNSIVMNKGNELISVNNINVVIIDFKTGIKDRMPNNFIVILDNDTQRFIGYGLLE